MSPRRGGILARFSCPFPEGLFMAQKNKDPEKIDRGRRQFLKATGMAPIAASVAGAAGGAAQNGATNVGPRGGPVEVMVKGKRLPPPLAPRSTPPQPIPNQTEL